MNSLLDVRLGAQEPAILHRPPGVVSLAAAEEAIELADAYGVCDGFPLAESQKITLRAALGERADGSWAATRVGDFGPRQGTGKSDKIAVRELAGLILFGEQLIIHTAHEFPTANECFLRLVAVFENWDDLRKRVARIRYANGEQGIELNTGQRLKYRARTGGSGRGFAKADLLVYDEAQHLSREHVAASGPAKMANPNSQTWYAGSGGLATSAIAWSLRRDAALGRGGRLAYTESTAEKIKVVGDRLVTSAPDPADRDAWYGAIPGLGRWVTEEGVQAQFDELGPDLFARECLCVWDPEPSSGDDGLFPGWAAFVAPGSAMGTEPVFGVDADSSRVGSVAVVWQRDGLTFGELACEPLPAHELPAKVRKIAGSRPVAAPPALVEDLRRAGCRVSEVKPSEWPQASALLMDTFATRAFRHAGQRALDDAARSVQPGRQSSSGAVPFSLQSPGAGPLFALTRAMYGLIARPVTPTKPTAFKGHTEMADVASMQF